MDLGAVQRAAHETHTGRRTVGRNHPRAGLDRMTLHDGGIEEEFIQYGEPQFTRDVF